MWNKDWKKGIDYPAWGDTDVYKKTIAGGYLYNASRHVMLICVFQQLLRSVYIAQN